MSTYIEQLISAHTHAGNHELQWHGGTIQVSQNVFSPALAESSIFFADVIKTMPLHNHDVVDAGCGCGLLAIAALIAGANKVLAYDCNPQAVACAKSNIEAWGFSSRINVLCSSDWPQMEKCQSVIVNPPFYDQLYSEDWQSCFFDPRRRFLRTVISGCANSFSANGCLLMITGGPLHLEEITPLLSEYRFRYRKVLAERQGQIELKVISTNHSKK